MATKCQIFFMPRSLTMQIITIAVWGDHLFTLNKNGFHAKLRKNHKNAHR